MNMGSASRKCSNRLDTEGKKRNWKKKKKHTHKKFCHFQTLGLWTCTHISGPQYLPPDIGDISLFVVRMV